MPPAPVQWQAIFGDLQVAVVCPATPGASAEVGAQLLELQQQLFGQWHQWKVGAIDWLQLQQGCRPIRRSFEAVLQRVVDLGSQGGAVVSFPSVGLPEQGQIHCAAMDLSTSWR